jgi:DNA-directed RNA polymerase specialized sigma24 family protein
MKVLLPASQYAMTFEEIGEALGISPDVAKQDCYKALRKLKKLPAMAECLELAAEKDKMGESA